MDKSRPDPYQKQNGARTPSKADIETRWDDAWNDLYDLVETNNYIPCLLPDGVVVDVESGKAWLQVSVYQGYQVKVERGHVIGDPGIIRPRSV